VWNQEWLFCAPTEPESFLRSSDLSQGNNRLCYLLARHRMLGWFRQWQSDPKSDEKRTYRTIIQHTLSWAFKPQRWSLNMRMIFARVAFWPGIVMYFVARDATLIISWNLGCWRACIGYKIEYVSDINTVATRPNEIESLTWSVATSHSTEAWQNNLSE
jgi:hypothetical protein